MFFRKIGGVGFGGGIDFSVISCKKKTDRKNWPQQIDKQNPTCVWQLTWAQLLSCQNQGTMGGGGWVCAQFYFQALNFHGNPLGKIHGVSLIDSVCVPAFSVQGYQIFEHFKFKVPQVVYKLENKDTRFILIFHLPLSIFHSKESTSIFGKPTSLNIHVSLILLFLFHVFSFLQSLLG